MLFPASELGRYQGASAPLQHPDNAELTGSQPNADYQVTSTSFQCPNNQRSTGNSALCTKNQKYIA